MLLSIAWASTVHAQVAVVANPSVPVDSLDKAYLLKLYLGTTEFWDNQTRVVIVDLSHQGNVRDSFYAYLGRTSSRMRSIWLKRKLTGEGELPESIDSEEKLLELVASTEGAIGFVSASVAANHPAIKVLISEIPLIEPD